MAEDSPTTVELADWLARARQGDAAAYCRVAAFHEARLYQQALALCANPQTAEDLASETLVAALRSLSRFDGSCRFSTWLYAILIRRHLQWRRRERSRPVSLASLPSREATDPVRLLEQVADPQPSASDSLVRREKAEQMLEAISRLPAIHQAVILLRYYEEASLAEIGAALDLPLGTVKSRLHHALAALRREPGLVNLFAMGGDS